MDINQDKTLTAFCPLGLSNRLRVLLSGLALAEAAGRRFTMLWPITPACAAPFADLFANDWPVQTVDAAALKDLSYVSGWFGELPDLLIDHNPHLVIGHPSWLIRPGQFSAHDRLLDRCRSLLAGLQPAIPIQQVVSEFRQCHFRPTMIGVHLRRGDFLRERPDTANNTAQAFAMISRFLDESPDAGILLCSDDGAPDPKNGRPTQGEGVYAKCAARYGARVISPIQRSGDRSSTLAIQDALSEFYLLRSCNYFVGTVGSSFSEMVVFGQDLPHTLVAGATPLYAALEYLARWTGLYRLLAKLGQKRTGNILPFPVLLRYYKKRPLLWLRRHWPG